MRNGFFILVPNVVNIRSFRTPDGKYVLPDDVVRVDRGTPWGNPMKIGSPDPNGYPMDRQQVINWYERYATAKLESEPDWLAPLVGKRLACWCAPSACHADILIRLRDAQK